MTAHAVRSVRVRDDDLPEPEAYVADVVCACFQIFTSEVQPSEDEAIADVKAQFHAHEPKP